MAHAALAEVVPLAPAIPAGLLALLGLVAFLGYLVATGTLKVYAVSLGRLILWLAGQFDRGFTILHRRVHPFGVIARGLRALDGEIRDSIAALALEAEHGASWLFTTAGNIMSWTGREIGDLADTVAKALHLQRAVEIPRTFRLAVAHTATRVHGIADDLAGLKAQAAAQWRRLAAGIDTLKHTITVTIPQRIAGVEAQVRPIPREIARLGARVKTVEHRLGAKAFAGAVAVALGALGLSWIRCGRVGKAGKSICRMDPDVLDSLLAGSLILASGVSLAQLARELQEPTELVTDAVRSLVHEF